MAKFRFINSRFDAEWGFQLNDGRIIEIIKFGDEGFSNRFVMRYDTPINLETQEIYEGQSAPKGFTTLNELKRLGLGKTVYCYDEFDVDLGWIRTMSQIRVNKICETFRRNGFNVAPDAVWHNYGAWVSGFKSGYRDEENGYHLFTPCGGNPLSFRATTLNQMCDDWQTTYTC